MNGYVFTLLFVPLIAFTVIVLPTWLTMYYRDKNRQSRELSGAEWEEIQRTLEHAEHLEQRVVSLEAILDAEHKDWRKEA